ncbi:hypothetical protein [Jeotgalibacillus campisalis]|uniref:Swarming motility protein SwrB n=1 Tax=Jeotgalibacillus campisalis TaxID=220754 RepID=A0A0C2VUR5_9BACL|nr:hypothetical protein [Jeotgalibacillus campisalis]KIL47743.1 hypothetical protein KR50_19100 [Jeotgalibacillus campisalis]
MIIFLLILSILFNLIAFLSIYLLFMRQNKLIHQEEKHKKTLNDFEETFTSYLEELKEDNENFLSKFEQIQQSPRIENIEYDTEKTTEKKQANAVVDNGVIGGQRDAVKKAARALAANRYKKKPVPHNQFEITEDESYEQKVFRYNKEGFSAAQIAKRLHKGQTEVELMLKFRNKSN